eukprot:CAMPEP_0204583810 /NCGR_PEP_ID=MMETSP0661-20131031/45987_1 /ASSEMBLY_ACC=CAM_ASM_000606 /TAXON_ID=109239 /ORGANISM="Alexandrium margalefi, Strain AMGDE01CS-322" /LENGTH=117 /DNA_ID=CAMNT_0051593201 /DNA_START=72 /DNA_END=422 /DNA_ORIENTATION=-
MAPASALRSAAAALAAAAVLFATAGAHGHAQNHNNHNNHNGINCLNSTYHTMPDGTVMRNDAMATDPCASCTSFPCMPSSMAHMSTTAMVSRAASGNPWPIVGVLAVAAAALGGDDA